MNKYLLPFQIYELIYYYNAVELFGMIFFRNYYFNYTPLIHLLFVLTFNLLGILDLYGFESFEHGNSLEQLCINYANERLQHYFTINYLKEQQLLLTNEGNYFKLLSFNDF